MQDAVTSLLNKYDLTGRYLDNVAIDELNDYFSTALNRIKIIELISENASKIIKEASARLYEEQPELLRPGGNSYTTRRYAACLRDIEYYLRYSSYSLIAGNTCILNERVLDGLKDTYNSLNVPISPTVRSIQLLENIIKEKAIAKKITGFSMINEPFNHIIKALSEQDV